MNLREHSVCGQTVRFSTKEPFAKEWLDAVGFYEPKITKLVVDLLATSSTFVDVGAFIGWFAVIAAQFSKEVYAFEMNYRAWAQLKMNAGLNLPAASHVVTELLAVWDEPNVVGYAPEDRPAIGISEDGPVMARAVTLDQYFANRKLPDVVKIDVEGAEAKVLAGMRGILDAGCHVIMEIHKGKMEAYGDHPRAMLDELELMGYTIRQIETGKLGVPCPMPRNFHIHAFK